MTPEDQQTLLKVAQWIVTHRNTRRTIRQLAETEENYLLLIRELDRVERQCFRAHTLHAEATLTLVEWLAIFNLFHLHCAYCHTLPFQAMNHRLPLPQAGTTTSNYVPACYHFCLFHEEVNK